MFLSWRRGQRTGMRKISFSSNSNQIILVSTYCFLAIVHWVSFASIGGIYINNSTEQYGNLPVQLGLVFIIHGFFLAGLKSTFGLKGVVEYSIFGSFVAAILLSAASFYTTGTIFGSIRLNLYEPIMISLLFVFGLVLYFSRILRKKGVAET